MGWSNRKDGAAEDHDEPHEDAEEGSDEEKREERRGRMKRIRSGRRLERVEARDGVDSSLEAALFASRGRRRGRSPPN